MEQHSSPFLMSSDHVSRRRQWFTCVHLLISHLTQSSCAFSVTLTTPALYRRSLRWFGGCFQKPPPEGLPPSQLQLRADRLCSRVTPVSPWQFSCTTKEKLFLVLFVVPFFSEPFTTPFFAKVLMACKIQDLPDPVRNDSGVK